MKVVIDGEIVIAKFGDATVKILEQHGRILQIQVIEGQLPAGPDSFTRGFCIRTNPN